MGHLGCIAKGDALLVQHWDAQVMYVSTALGLRRLRTLSVRVCVIDLKFVWIVANSPRARLRA
jgi:hypothetical protein